MTPSAMAVFVMTLNCSAASHGSVNAMSGSQPSQPATTLMENVSQGSVASCLQALAAVTAAQIAAPHAEAAFVHAFCRDRSLLLGVEGYALTSLEVALATPPRPDDAMPVAPVPAPPTAVAA